MIIIQVTILETASGELALHHRGIVPPSGFTAKEKDAANKLKEHLVVWDTEVLPDANIVNLFERDVKPRDQKDPS